jgi:DNA polymerase III alpha subunit
VEYASLHNHTDASPDGAGTVDSLVKRAKELGMKYLGCTDHGTLGNAVAFWSACEEQGVVPIQGLEAYLLYNNKRHHLTLLSTSEEGFNNLVHLDTLSHDSGYVGGYPTLTLDDIAKHNTDLFALSGCAASALFVDEETEALKYIGELMWAVGPDNIALECMFVGTHNTWSRPIEFAKRVALPFVVTNDTHYPCKHQFQAHQTVCSARRGFTYDSQHLWLKSYDEILEEGRKFTHESLVRIGLANTRIVTDRVKPWSLKAPPSLPHIENCENIHERASSERQGWSMSGVSLRVVASWITFTFSGTLLPGLRSLVSRWGQVVVRVVVVTSSIFSVSLALTRLNMGYSFSDLLTPVALIILTLMWISRVTADKRS